MEYFKFNGKTSIELGALIAKRPTYVTAERDRSQDSLPFKDGDVIVDNGRYKNVDVDVPIRAVPYFCHLSRYEFERRLSDWLTTENYCEYRDTYNPGYFRSGIVRKIGDIVAVQRDVFESTISFSFAPYWYSDRGASTLTLSSSENAVSTTLRNPETRTSEPLIKIVGSGDFDCNIAGVQFTLTGVSGSIVIDKATENVYDASGTPVNNKLSALELPFFNAGDNAINISGSSSFNVEITPRWRRL